MLSRIKAEAADSYRQFRTTAELGRLVRDDLATLLSERFASAEAADRGAADRGAADEEPRSRAAARPLPASATQLDLAG